MPSSTSSARARRRELNIAQILVTVPEGAVRRRGRAAPRAGRAGAGAGAQRRDLRGGGRAPCPKTATSERGGEIGLRPANRLPDAFVEQVRGLKPGEVAPTLLRSGAGFHLLKLLERHDGAAFSVDADARPPHPAAAERRS